jgi:hypothetical protein
MKKIQEEMRLETEDWQLHKKEFEEQMKKAQEEVKKAYEEMLKNKESGYFPDFPLFYKYPQGPVIGVPLPPEMGIEIPEIPEIDELIPADPQPSVDIESEAQYEKDTRDSESRNATLKDLENDTEH